MMRTELEKLRDYAGGEAVEADTVSELVTNAQDAKVWDLTDAIVEANERKALRSLARLLDEGQPPQMLLFMVARAYRQLVLVKDLRDRRVRRDEIQEVSGVQKFKMDSALNIAGRSTWDGLRRAYQRILEADLSVKRGLVSDEAALQMLVHDLCAMAPRSGGARPAYSR
jgi:DNA polymerase-3 subunit delta